MILQTNGSLLLKIAQRQLLKHLLKHSWTDSPWLLFHSKPWKYWRQWGISQENTPRTLLTTWSIFTTDARLIWHKMFHMLYRHWIVKFNPSQNPNWLQDIKIAVNCCQVAISPKPGQEMQPQPVKQTSNGEGHWDQCTNINSEKRHDSLTAITVSQNSHCWGVQQGPATSSYQNTGQPQNQDKQQQSSYYGGKFLHHISQCPASMSHVWSLRKSSQMFAMGVCACLIYQNWIGQERHTSNKTRKTLAL